MENYITFVPMNEHPEMYIGEPLAAQVTDNNANTAYSQDTGAWD